MLLSPRVTSQLLLAFPLSTFIFPPFSIQLIVWPQAALRISITWLSFVPFLFELLFSSLSFDRTAIENSEQSVPFSGSQGFCSG